MPESISQQIRDDPLSELVWGFKVVYEIDGKDVTIRMVDETKFDEFLRGFIDIPEGANLKSADFGLWPKLKVYEKK